MKKPDHTTGEFHVRRLPFLQIFLFVLLLLGLGAIQNAKAQSYAFSNLWSVAASSPAPASHPFLATDNNTRGLAYNPVTDHLLVVSRSGSNAVYVLNSTDGAILGTLPYDAGIVQGGNFAVSMIGITDDGVIYVGNLTTDATGASGPFKLYRWADESAQPTLAYSGDPSGGNTVGTSPRRFGDSLAVRGTGASTQILLGTFNKVVGLLWTSDGINFDSKAISTDISDGDSRWGLDWGAGNTFWVKQGSSNLKNVTLDLVANTGTVTTSIPLAAGPGGPLDVDLSRNLIAIVDTANSTSSTTHKLRVFDISNPSAPIQVDSTKSFPVVSVNGNLVGAVSFRNGRLYALDTNNGILGYYVQDGVYYPVTIASLSDVTLWDGAENWTFNPVVSGTPPYSFQWQRDGADISGATGQSYTIPHPATLADEGAYTLIVSNQVSSATRSANAYVQLGNASGQVSNIWNVAADSRPYLTTAYREYAVAINPLTTNVIVVTSKPNPTNMIAVLDIETGAHKHYIDYTALNPVSFSKATVADDGVIFVCNQTGDAASSPFKIYGFSDDNPTPALTGFLYAEDPGAGIAPSNIGWGANIDARGGGMDTEILIGSGKWAATPINTKYVAILKYNAEMSGFVSTPIEVTNAPVSNNTFRFGICWGPGNTFWVKGYQVGLMLVEYDLASGKGWIKKQYPIAGARSTPASLGGMAFDSDTQLLAGLQNGSPPTPVSVSIYDVSDTETGPFWVDQELFTSYNADIEFGGTVSFEKGYIVALGCNNGLKAMKVNPGFTASLPVIIAHPSDGEWFESTSPTLSVVADSMTPLSYQWYYYGTQEIAGATSSTLTITNIQASQAGDYMVRVSNAGGSRDSQPGTITLLPLYSTAQMTNIWSVQSLTRPYLHDYYFEYGMAFNPVNSNLLVASYVYTNTTLTIAVLDALTGADKHVLDVSAVTNGGNRWINKIGVADDGVVYVGNRSSGGSTIPFVVYRWADDAATTVASEAYKGDPFGTMYPLKNRGWTMDVRGSGVNTEILLSTSGTNILSILTTTDGMNFTAKEILVEGAAPNFARLGVCFGAGNTVWTKAWYADGGLMHLVQYDLSAGTGTILRTYTDMPGTMTTLAYNDSLKFLAGMARDDQKNIYLYSVADLDYGPMLLDQELFPTYYPEIEANGALDFGGNTYLFGLDENNGIIAMQINPTYAPPAVLKATAVGGTVTITWFAVNGATYQVQQKSTLDGTWQDLGSPITATSTTASYSESVLAGPRFYRVQSINP